MPETEAPELPAVVEETSQPTDAPAAPEGAAPSAPADEAVITEPAAGLSTRPRGPDGRFIKADGTEASEAEHAAIEAADPASPPTPVTQPPAPPSATPGEPFVFRADGQKIPIPGSSVSPDGHLTIPADQVPAIRQLLAEGVSHRGSWRTKEQEYRQQIQDAKAQAESGGKKYNDAAVHMLNQLESEQWQAEFRTDPQRALHYLKRDIGLLLKEADLKAPRAIEQPAQDPQVEHERLESAARATLQGYVEELLDSPQAKAIYTTPEERKAAIARYTRRMNAYFVENEGEVVLHENAVDEDFKEELAVRQAARTAAANATKAHEFNAKRNAPPVAPPPVVSTKGPGSNNSGSRPTFKTREEYRKAMGMN